jgi:DNA-binding transcriptional LysR family regulator
MLDLVQLRSFLAIAQTASFTDAARKLDLGQSTVSQHLQKLETELGRRLIARDTHKVLLTAEGEALVSHARSMLGLESQIKAMFDRTQLRGKLRLGVSEDFVTNRLHIVLQDFAERHPNVELELTVALSGPLYDLLEAGEIDLVLAKRRFGETRGQLVYRESLVWLASDPDRMLASDVLPLIVFPAPSVTRSVILKTLADTDISWRIACTCGSLSGLVAAARGGLGVLVQPRSMIPSGLIEVDPDRLPPLEDIEFVLMSRKGQHDRMITAISEDVITRVRRLRTP